MSFLTTKTDIDILADSQKRILGTMHMLKANRSMLRLTLRFNLTYEDDVSLAKIYMEQNMYFFFFQGGEGVLKLTIFEP